MREIRQIKHLFKVSTSLLNSLSVSLIDDEHIGDFHQASLIRLHAVTPTWVDDDDCCVCFASNLNFDLTDPDRLDQDPLASKGIK